MESHSTADLALRLLSVPDFSANLKAEEVRALFGLARENVCLIRISQALAKKNIFVPEEWQTQIQEEEQRISQTIRVISEISSICKEAGIKHLFTKSFQHLPDMGHDIDLLLEGTNCSTDAILKKQLSLSRAFNSFTNYVAGKRAYEILGVHTPLEIHHGRLGHVGEHAEYAKQILERGQPVALKNSSVWVPSDEDRLILGVLQRIYSHLYFRISDLVSAFQFIPKPNLNWNYILSTTEKMGISLGLKYYLTFSELKWKQLTGQTLIPSAQSHLLLSEITPLTFKKKAYRFNRLTLGGRLYLAKISNDFAHARFYSLRQLSTLPFLGALITLRALARRLIPS